MSSGRKKDPIWIYFKELPVVPGKSGLRATCKKCNKELQGIVSRLKAHHKKCSEKKVSSSDDECEIVENSAKSDLVNPVEKSVLNLSKKKIGGMKKFVVSTSKQEKEIMDKQCARFLYGTNSPFVTVENDEFKKFLQLLRPGYNPPDRHTVGSKLLNEIYQEERDKAKHLLKNEVVCMSSDGWSNVTNNPIVCTTITKDNGQVILVDTIDSSGTQHSSENLLKMMEEAIKKTEVDFNCQIKSFVTDSAANMVKMRRDLQERCNSNIISYGCSAHCCNLLAQDFGKMNNNPKVKEHIMQILKYFKNHHLPKAWYEAANGSAIVLPIDVRWNSTCEALRCYVKNWAVFNQVCEEYRDHPSMDKDICTKVRNFYIHFLLYDF